MKKKQVILAENSSINQYVEQSFPVIEREAYGLIHKSVEVIASHGKSKSIECDYFTVEVVKDYDGYISFIVYGKPVYDPKADMADQRFGVQILRTDDFNLAYDLKNRLNALAGHNPSERQKMHCHGSLQREKTLWE